MDKEITKINQCPKGRETFKIPLEQVRLRTDMGAFHRNDWGDLDGLARSIKTNGQRVAGEVWRVEDPDGKVFFEVVSGERRFKAIQIANQKYDAGITFYWASNAPLSPAGGKMSDLETLYHNIHQNSGKEFTQEEHGKAFQIMVTAGESILVIAEKVGKSPTWVRECIAYVESVPEAIKARVRNKRMSYSTGKKLGKAPKQVQEDTLLKSDLNPEKKIKGKDVDAAVNETKEPVIPEDPNTPVNNLDNMLKGYLDNGWKLKSDVQKDGTIGRYNSFAIIGTMTPPVKYELVGR